MKAQEKYICAMRHVEVDGKTTLCNAYRMEHAWELNKDDYERNSVAWEWLKNNEKRV